MTRVLAIVAFLVTGATVCAQNFDPPPAKTPDAATLKKIEEQTAKLKQAVAEASKKVPEHEADLAIYCKAAEWIVRHQEWFTTDSGKQTLAVIEQGLKRAESAREGKMPWLEVEGRAVARGYRSVVDRSVQPYGVIYPPGYGKDKTKKWRLDLHLHGRDSSLTEVKHLYQHAGKEAPKDQDYVQINVYGRGNNAYRWAGEQDVFEALQHFRRIDRLVQKADLIDGNRFVLKGFSMGGAGTWHIGLRRPEWFAAIQPGAGFTTTHGYIAGLPDPLPDYQEKCLSVYDAYRYAENAFNVPVVAYSGEKDKQKLAADNIERELARLKLSDRMTHVIGPGLEHKFPPEWQKEVEAKLQAHVGSGKGLAAYPERVRFTTWTLMQSRCYWVTLERLEKHYSPANIDARWDGTTFDISTKNVSRFFIVPPKDRTFPKTLTIDGRQVRAASSKKPGYGQYFHKDEGEWRSIDVNEELFRKVQKNPLAMGPIDDAFAAQFCCVVGTGEPWHPKMHAAALAQLDRFRREWDKWMRGELIVKKDTELTDAERRSRSLILFGDPGSNTLIAEVLPQLPIRWTKTELEFDGTRYDPAAHLPLLIQGESLYPGSYVVLNSGHTFHEADFKGTNALLYPRLGDFAVVKPTPTAKDPAAFEVITAGLFDEDWQFPKK